jgi:hypothetical protein
MRRLVGVIALLLATSASAMAIGSSIPYGKGGWFEQFDPIVRQYNQSGEQFASKDIANRPARYFSGSGTSASTAARGSCSTPAMIDDETSARRRRAT